LVLTIVLVSVGTISTLYFVYSREGNVAGEAFRSFSKVACVDSDGGNEKTIFSTVTKNGFKYNDYCFDEETPSYYENIQMNECTDERLHYEFYCEDNLVKIHITCNTTMVCDNGMMYKGGQIGGMVQLLTNI